MALQPITTGDHHEIHNSTDKIRSTKRESRLLCILQDRRGLCLLLLLAIITDIQEPTITTQETIMIDIKQLVYKALSGDERAYRQLVSRYGKVTTEELLKAGSAQCRH